MCLSPNLSGISTEMTVFSPTVIFFLFLKGTVHPLPLENNTIELFEIFLHILGLS